MDYTRRRFLKRITGATLAAAGLPALTSGCVRADANEGDGQYDVLSAGDRIVFQGDSITDADRDRASSEANTGLGSGYAFICSARLLDRLSPLGLRIFNRGVSGNKICQLSERWQADCLQLQPDLVSILIGVNDFWQMYLSNYDGTLQTYRADLRALLERTRRHNPDVTLVIGEPFALPGGRAVEEDWYPDYRSFQEAAREIASAFNAGFVPYQAIFEEASAGAEAAYWTCDGVHPTAAGCHLMAEAWLQTVRHM